MRDEVCQFVDSAGSVSIKFNQKPIVEEELGIVVKLTEGLVLSSAWVEGVNMYMGKTPIIPKKLENFDIKHAELNAKKTFNGILFLGSCTEPRMQWVLFLEVKNTKTQANKVYKVLFSTSIN